MQIVDISSSIATGKRMPQIAQSGCEMKVILLQQVGHRECAIITEALQSKQVGEQTKSSIWLASIFMLYQLTLTISLIGNDFNNDHF